MNSPLSPSDVADGPFALKRAYEPPQAEDGVRVLVDRLWPRGLKKAGAKIDLWLRDVAPSPGLRRWFGHRPEHWEVFRERYAAELQGNTAFDHLRDLAQQGRVTLLYAAKDQAHNHALVLLDRLRAQNQDSREETPPWT